MHYITKEEKVNIFLQSYPHAKMQNVYGNSIFAGKSSKIKDAETAFVYDFSTRKRTERTILNLVSTIGLSSQLNGTKFLIKGLTYFIGIGEPPNRAGDFFRYLANCVGESVRSVQMSIKRAFVNAGFMQLQKINRLFFAEIVPLNNDLNVSELLVKLSTYLVMLKHHQHDRTLF